MKYDIKKNTFGQKFLPEKHSGKNFGGTVYLPGYARAWRKASLFRSQYLCLLFFDIGGAILSIFLGR